MSGRTGPGGESAAVLVSLAELASVMGVYAPARFRGAAIRALCSDSRLAVPGSLFFAVPGSRDDGALHVPDALARGAVAVVAERSAGLASRAGLNAPLLEVEGVRRAKALAAHAVHGHPSAAIACTGITGTKGKTTTSMLLRSILEEAGQRPTLIGTIEERVWGEPPLPATHTTPDALRIAELLARARAVGGRSAVLEVSSHALDQERTAGLEFRAAVFTQIAREHLDYHPTVEHYRASKARLFEALAPDAAAVVNGEDPAALELAARSRARLVSFGDFPAAHVRPRLVESGVRGSRFELHVAAELASGPIPIETALVGRHNLMNATAAATAALALQVDPDAIVRGIATLTQVPGRLERVEAGQPFDVLVDYAHTDDSLEKVLRVLRPMVSGRLVTVFGCGGNRDRGKRPRMGRVAATLSDRVVLTSDNPRDESPESILDEVLRGVPAGADVRVEPDRRRAIECAIAGARAGDLVLLAGKGHETTQVAGGASRRFDDREVAREVLCRCCA
jgi:UDP-N-acetylmuramoyl-L-alanyl-D-glutamate--2,6-diaminopimelate ligase